MIMNKQDIDNKIKEHKKLRKEFLELNENFLNSHKGVFDFSDEKAKEIMKKWKEEDDLFKEIQDNLLNNFTRT